MDSGIPAPVLDGKRAFGLLVTFLLVQLSVGILGGFVLAMLNATSGLSAAEFMGSRAGTAVIPITLASYFVSGAVAFAMVRRSFPGPVREGRLSPIGWVRTAPQRILLCVLAGIVISVFYLRFAVLLFPPAETQEFGGLSTAASTAVGLSKWLWAGVVLVAAPVEEFLFRGALLTGFTRSLGAVPAGILVTLFFVLGHLPETHLYYPAIASIALLAAAALAARLWSGSLLPPIGLHAAYNLTIIVDSLG